MDYQQNNNQGCLRDPIWQFIWGFISAILAIVAIIIAIIALPPAAPVRQGISQIFKSTPEPTPPPPLIITKNINIPCATCRYPVTLFLKTITVDAANQSTTFLFNVTNNDTSGITLYLDGSLQDDNGNTTNASVAQGGKQFYLETGSSSLESLPFSLAIKTKTHYNFKVSLGNIMYSLNYKDQDISI